MICEVCGVEECEPKSRKCRYCRLLARRNRERLQYSDRREMFVAQLGGKCVDCGSIKKLEFDHVFAEMKSFHINSRLANASIELLQNEINKCVLRCRPCHVKKTTDEGEWNK